MLVTLFAFLLFSIFLFYFFGSFIFYDLIVVQGYPLKIILVFFCYCIVSLLFFSLLILPLHFFFFIDSKFMFQFET